MTVKKILILAANPKDTNQLRLGEEAREIEDSLNLAKYGGSFQVISRWAVRIDDLQDALLRHEPQILHFSGHGAGEKGLVLENQDGHAQCVKAEALAGLFELFEIECAVLNACYTDIQAQTISQHVSYVVGMKQVIGDKAAINFVKGFYKALGSGRSYEKSFKFGQNSIDLQSIPEKSTPIFKTGSVEKLEQVSEPGFLSAITSGAPEDSQSQAIILEEPGGPVVLDSLFYIERPQIELQCYETISKPGSLIRIKAPPQTGKSSLMIRIIHYAKQENCQSVRLNFQLAGLSDLASLEDFLYWFCSSIIEELEITNNLKDYWESSTGVLNRCTRFFKKSLLPRIDSALVLALDQVDEIFRAPEIAADFFRMLRTWHEEARSEPIWQKLRLILAYSKEFHSSTINFSPFNVGLAIVLRELNLSQVKDFAKRHGLVLSQQQLQQIMHMFGGHPYLIHIALYQVACQIIDLEELFLSIPKQTELYEETLSLYLKNLEADISLLEEFKLILTERSEMKISSKSALQLQSMGLVKYQDNSNELILFCELYRRFFSDRLGVS